MVSVMSRKILRFIGLTGSVRNFAPVLAAVFTVLLWAPSASAEDAGAWVVKQTAGSVSYSHRDGRWEDLAKGQRLLPGTKLKSGSAGRASIERYGDSITISPSSAVELPAAKGGAGVSGVVQTMGTLLFKIVKRKKNRFSVRTPYLSAVIKGTTFTVTVGPAGSALHVTEGAVQVSSLFTGETALIRPGQTGEVSGTGRRGLRVLQGRRSLLRKSPARGKSSRSAKIRRSLGPKRIDIPEVTKGLAQGHGPKSNGKGKSSSSGNKNAGPNSMSDVASGMTSGPVSAGSNSASSNGASNASPQGVAVGLTGATPPGLVNNANSDAGGNGKGKGKNK